MRDLVVEKASPFALVIVVAWTLDGPRTLICGVIHQFCCSLSQLFAMLAGFFG